jgi:hypothetical protein
MNDGCSILSVAAARSIWEALGGAGMIPSVFQGRINAAKGVWIRNGSTDSTLPKEMNRWIHINVSQRKFGPHPDFDPHRSCFEVVKYSKRAQPSTIHKSFILILIDRGVPIDAIEGFFNRTLAAERSVMVQAINSPENLLKWLPRVTADSDDEAPDAGVPGPLVLKVQDRLVHGFDPKKDRALATDVREVVRRQLMSKVDTFAVTLLRSTHVLGVADPTKTLKPGEIFLSFSHGFAVEDHHYAHLDDKEVLVSRHPACRPSDIQKVKAVFRPELQHIQDVVVFPSTGCVPLASKLGGGDYDGDTFWVCWEPELVAGFLNAPLPKNSPKPESFGIKVDGRKVSEMVKPHLGNDLPSLQTFLENAFQFQLSPTLLGNVTKYYDRYCYKTLSSSSPGALALADLHDLLVDSAKNGFTFTDADFEAFKKKHNLPKDLPPLAYEMAFEPWKSSTYRSCGDMVGASPKRKSTPPPKYNRAHPLDRLLFDVVIPHVNETLDLVDQVLVQAEEDVSALSRPVAELEKMYKGGGIVYTQLKALEQCLATLKEQEKAWKTSGKTWKERADLLKIEVSRLEPQHPELKEHWLLKVGNSPSYWELLKASAFTSVFSRMYANALFWRELGHLQAYQNENGPLPVVSTIWAQLKPKKFEVQEQDWEESGDGPSFGDGWDDE